MKEFKTVEEVDVYANVKNGKLYREEGKNDLSLKEFERLLSQISPESNPTLYNMLQNEIEITQGKVILESKPRGLAITLTNRCNIQCIMCSVWQAPWDIPEKTVKEIIEFFPYLERIFWQGGEVFLSPYFKELFEKVSSYPNIRQDINTNGLLITKEWAKNLVKANVNMIFSIDGVTKKTYEDIRKGARFEDLLKSIDNLNECMKDVQQDITYRRRRCSAIINLVVMKSNYHELSEFIDFAKEYRFERLQITPVDIGNQENIFRYNDKEALTYIDSVMPEIMKKAAEYGISLSNWLPVGKSSVLSKPEQDSSSPEIEQINDHVETNRKVMKPNRMSCYWAWQFLFIDWGGVVRPQCFCDKRIGNVCDNSLDEIWNNEEMQKYREKLFDNNYQNWCNSRCVMGNIAKESLSLD